MLNKYNNEFEEMHERIKQNESPIRVVGDYAHIFEKDGIGLLGAINYLSGYIQRENCKL